MTVSVTVKVERGGGHGHSHSHILFTLVGTWHFLCRAVGSLGKKKNIAASRLAEGVNILRAKLICRKLKS